MFSLLCNKVFRAWLLPLTFISFSDPFLRVISYLGGLSPTIDHGYSTNTYGPSSLCAGVPLSSWRWAVSVSCCKNLTRSRIALCSRYRSATDSGTYPFNFVRFQRWSIIYRSNVFTSPNNSSAGVHPVVEWYHSHLKTYALCGCQRHRCRIIFIDYSDYEGLWMYILIILKYVLTP